MEAYILYLENIGKSENTIRTYINGLNTFIRWYEQTNNIKINFKYVSSTDIEDYYNYLIYKAKYRDKNLSPSTIKIKMKAIKIYFNYLISSSVVKENPIKSIPHKKSDEPLKVWLNTSEKQELLSYLTKNELKEKNSWKYWRNVTIIYLMLYGGLRISEVAALRLNDIDSKFINIENNEKGNNRTVPISIDTWNAYNNWVYKRGNIQDKSLFMSQKNQPLSIDGIQHYFKSIRKNFSFNVTPIILRNTYGYELFQDGATTQEVAVLMGLTTLESTKLYKMDRK
ncbi:tyrosine-type recombinase/integrase [Gottfriedia solisilvae]|uniref:tyrosine-type recombinase/integrase n=1 Tax=Gottfriedia solisilvae TaxID=1516104 RepID=UPI003D2EC892